jgi:hypothetical protein
MGMFDYVICHKKFLPKEIENVELDWQTKSYEKILITLVIEEDSKLYEGYFIDNGIDEKTELKFLNYTGEIKFYTSIGKEWWELVAFFEKGILLKCIQVMPER